MAQSLPFRAISSRK